MYRWVVFLHILSAFVFFLVHGASALMALQLRREREVGRIRALLDLSQAAVPIAYFTLLILVVAGIAAGIMGGWFGQGWIWTALILLVVLWFVMGFYAARFYTPVRRAVGLPDRGRGGEQPAGAPADEATIAAAILATRPGWLMGGSLTIVAVILWLMMFKPF